MVEALALDLLASMLEESDDIPQPLLDTVLANLLPAKQKENPAACRWVMGCMQPFSSTAQRLQRLTFYASLWCLHCGRESHGWGLLGLWLQLGMGLCS